MHSIGACFRCVSRCSRLNLNPKKCVLVPLWANYVIEDLRECLRAAVPDWAGFSIADCAKYLGFFIGPGSCDREWSKVMKRLAEASSHIKMAGLPKLQGFDVFHMFGYSQLQFVAQLRAPCTELRRVELQNIRDLIGGPGLWAPTDAFMHLHSNIFSEGFESL